jgi:type I restriction enzyme, S subunit
MPNKYKQTEIGLLPSHWEVKKLGEIGKFTKGKGILKDELKEEGLPCIRYGEIYTKYNFNTSKLYSFISDDTSKLSQEISTGDVLMAGSGETIDEIGKAIAYLGTTKAYAGGDIIIFKPTNQNSLTISFLLESDSAKKQKRFMGQGNSVVHIYSSDLQKLKLPIPPLPEQQRIATILSTWDKAIDNVQYIIDNIQLRNKGLLNKLIMDNEQCIIGKKILTKLSDVFEESKIAGDENSSADKRITVRLNLKGIEKREFKGTEAEHATYFFKRKAGQFIYGKQNLHKGAFGIIPKELDGYESSSDIPTFDFKSGYDPKYILYYFSRPSFYEKLEDISTGTGSKRIQPKELFKVKIYAPPIKEQLKIVSILDTAKAELQHYQQKLAQLQLQKKGLMQLLLTGKIITV